MVTTPRSTQVRPGRAPPARAPAATTPPAGARRRARAARPRGVQGPQVAQPLQPRGERITGQQPVRRVEAQPGARGAAAVGDPQLALRWKNEACAEDMNGSSSTSSTPSPCRSASAACSPACSCRCAAPSAPRGTSSSHGDGRPVARGESPTGSSCGCVDEVWASASPAPPARGGDRCAPRASPGPARSARGSGRGRRREERAGVETNGRSGPGTSGGAPNPGLGLRRIRPGGTSRCSAGSGSSGVLPFSRGRP